MGVAANALRGPPVGDTTVRAWPARPLEGRELRHGRSNSQESCHDQGHQTDSQKSCYGYPPPQGTAD